MSNAETLSSYSHAKLCNCFKYYTSNALKVYSNLKPKQIAAFPQTAFCSVLYLLHISRPMQYVWHGTRKPVSVVYVVKVLPESRSNSGEKGPHAFNMIISGSTALHGLP